MIVNILRLCFFGSWLCHLLYFGLDPQFPCSRKVVAKISSVSVVVATCFALSEKQRLEKKYLLHMLCTTRFLSKLQSNHQPNKTSCAVFSSITANQTSLCERSPSTRQTGMTQRKQSMKCCQVFTHYCVCIKWVKALKWSLNKHSTKCSKNQPPKTGEDKYVWDRNIIHHHHI